MKKKKRGFGICKLVEIKNDLFFSLILDDNFYTVFKSAEETRVFGWIADDIVYKENQFALNDMVCADEHGVYTISHPHLYASYTGQHLDDILKNSLDKRELLMQLPEDSNPVIFYYEYKK